MEASPHGLGEGAGAPSPLAGRWRLRGGAPMRRAGTGALTRRAAPRP